MTISMIGIDHDRAPVDIRALFAFTKKNAGEAMERLKETAGIYGCIILSTCNRLEIWTSHEEEQEISMYECLCRLKGIQDTSYEKYFITKEILTPACHASTIYKKKNKKTRREKHEEKT